MKDIPPAAEAILTQMVPLWGHGEAARHDPVLINLLARHAACLDRLAPGLADRSRAAFEELASAGASAAEATR